MRLKIVTGVKSFSKPEQPQPKKSKFLSAILIEFEENGDATIVWAGNHDDYELTFKNNRKVIKKWLRDNNWI